METPRLRPSKDLLWTRHGFVTPSKLEDVRWIAGQLRDADRRELVDISGKPPEHSLTIAALCGDPCVTLWSRSGEPLAVLAVVRTGHEHGAIALSGTAQIEEFSTAFLRGSRDCLAVLHRSYNLLYNVCDARNVVHRRWLRWLGFREIQEIEGYGAEGITVVHFAKTRSE